MTHPIAELDMVTLATWLITVVVVVRRRVRGAGRARWVLVGLAVTSACHAGLMLTEWLGITTSLEHLEDYLGATLPMWWAFVIYAFAEEADAQDLRDSRAHFRTLVEQAADAVYVTDVDGRVTDANRETWSSLGYAREEILGAPVSLFEMGSSIRRYRETAAPSLSAGAPITIEGRHRRKDGTEFPVEIRLGALQLRSEGHLLALARDVSERKQAESERRKLHEELLQAQKLESIGLLAGGVAHDFGNLVTVIMGAVGELQAVPDLSPDARFAVEAIEKAADNAAEVTRTLLSMSRRETGQNGTANLAVVVRQCTDLVRRVMSPAIELSVETPEDGGPTVHLSPARLQQVVLNLAINARDAMPGGGKLRVGAREMSPDDREWVGSDGDLASGAVLTVSDTGTGIAPDILERVFEPLFTTKDAGRGTGLGLAIVRRIVESAGGRIHVESEIGKGTTFLIALPLAPEAGQPPAGA